MKDVTRDEINDAMQRFIADGGEIEKIIFKVDGMLLNNDRMLDRNYDGEATVLDELKLDTIFELATFSVAHIYIYIRATPQNNLLTSG